MLVMLESPCGWGVTLGREQTMARQPITAMLVCAAWMAATPALAENVVRFTGFAGGVLTFDPHSNFFKPDYVATSQVYEYLVGIDANLQLAPQLAVAWHPLSPTKWKFQLRQGVRFHDGTPFTAEDVVFSIERAKADSSGFKEHLQGIAAVMAVDVHTVHVDFAEPEPFPSTLLLDVAIMSKRWAREHGVTVPANLQAQEDTYATRRANGTGPFILETFEPMGDYAMVRNPDWWGYGNYPHNIDRIEQIGITAADAQLNALLEAAIDLLIDPPYASHDRIRSAPGLRLVATRRLLSQYLGLNQARSELASSNIRGDNPFRSRLVRQAMYQAIDIEAILRDLMGEALIPAGMVIAPGVNGYSSELDQRPAFDPEGARALLSQAGYPDGFSVTLDCPGEWGDDELATCRGVADQLGAIGIDVAVEFHGTGPYYQKLGRGESDFFLDAMHTSPDSLEVLQELFHSRGLRNYAGYSNPQMDELIEQIRGVMVTYARDALLEEAWEIAAEDLAYLPVRHSVAVFAMREELDLPPDPWAIPRFRLARLK